MGEFYALPEIDQDEAIALWTEQESTCPHCDQPRDVCSDPEVEWFPQRLVCYASMARQWAESSYERLHEAEPWHDGTYSQWSPKWSIETPYHYQHGVKIVVAPFDADPDDDFTGDPQAQPAALRASQKAVDQHDGAH